MASIRFMPHQKEAIDRLSTGSILCASVGTGKSITALGYYYIRVCHGVIWSDGRIGPMVEPRNLYIITTARKRDTHEWEDECNRFELDKEDISVTIDSWNNLHKYEDVNDVFFIFDEQRVVGSGSWVKSFIRVSKKNDWILLSATPGDTWMDYIPVFIANGFYKNRSNFLRRHAVYSRFAKYPKVERWLETGYLESLRRRITVTMEYDKKTVRHFSNVIVEYDKEKYRRVCEDRWNIYEDEPIRDISAACYLMRKVVGSDERRLTALSYLLEKAGRAIIFYNYDYELELLKKGLKDTVYDVAEWNGHRHDVIPKSDKWAYLVQYTAGAEGWNCVHTDTVIFFSQNYSYKLMTQAAGRIDRINTPYTDLYFYIMTSDAPIDKAITRALKRKGKFNEKNFMKW